MNYTDMKQVLVSSLNLFRVVISLAQFLPTRCDTPLYKEISRSNNTYITVLSEDSVLKEIRDFKNYQ